MAIFLKQSITLRVLMLCFNYRFQLKITDQEFKIDIKEFSVSFISKDNTLSFLVNTAIIL